MQGWNDGVNRRAPVGGTDNRRSSDGTGAFSCASISSVGININLQAEIGNQAKPKIGASALLFHPALGRFRVDALLEPISKSFEEDDQAGKLDKAEEIVGVVLPAND